MTVVIYRHGQTPETVEDTVNVPQEVDSWRGKLVLARTDGSEQGKTLYEEAKALVEQSGAETQALWDREVWCRDSTRIIALGTALGLSSDDIDNLFRQALGAS